MDGDGELCPIEFEAMIETLGVEFDRRQLNNILKRLDVDFSTTISFKELQRLINDKVQ